MPTYKMPTYKIVRFHFKGDLEIIETGLTLEEAKEHCKDPETSSRTCRTAAMVEYTQRHGMWFDGYEEED